MGNLPYGKDRTGLRSYKKKVIGEIEKSLLDLLPFGLLRTETFAVRSVLVQILIKLRSEWRGASREITF